MKAYDRGYLNGAATVAAIVAAALAVVYVKRVDIILWGLRKERAAIKNDPLGRVLTYLGD